MWTEGSLIQKDADTNKRRYHVRVPLFKPDICIGVDPVIGDADCVIDWNGIFGKQNFKDVPGGSDSTFSSKLSTYVFRVPTEPTALEFSFMIDYPRMAWARNPNNVGKSDYKNGAVITYGEKPDIDAIDNIDPDNFTKWVEEIQDEATYFDAVYWGPQSDQSLKKDENSISNPFAPPDPADFQRGASVNDPRLISGNSSKHVKDQSNQSLQLWGGVANYVGGDIFDEDPAASGGITEQGDYHRDATEDDNWYDVIIRDNTPPVITVVEC